MAQFYGMDGHGAVVSGKRRIMTAKTVFNQMNKRRRFELEEDELYLDISRVTDCDNEGDPDSLLYGCLSLDGRDSFEGFGVSADRDKEVSYQTGWTVFVNDYDAFNRLQSKEQDVSEAEDALLRCQQQIHIVEEKLTLARQEFVFQKREYNSIEPSLLAKGKCYSSKLSKLEKYLEYNHKRLSAANDSIRDLEASDHKEADAVAPDEGAYNTIHWNAVYQWGQAFIDKLDWKLGKIENGGLSELMDMIQSKRNRRELTFEHYVHLTGILSGELYKRTGANNYLNKRNKMAFLWKKYSLADRKNTSPYFPDDEILFDPSARHYSETKISEDELLMAIDLRTSASRVATRHNLTFDEAVSMLMDS